MHRLVSPAVKTISCRLGRRSFTLRDLLALTTVIALLLAAGLPLLTAVWKWKHHSGCLNSIKQLGLTAAGPKGGKPADEGDL